MAAEISSLRKSRHRGFMTVLSSAACEWFLIFLLSVNALFSYLLLKFACYCGLQTPCPLCSRIDHLFGRKKSESHSWSLLCSNHKEELSSLVPCSVHGKLADIHRMCEECLLPIALHKKSNSESCKLLVGKLWVDVEQAVLQNLMLNKHIQIGSSVCSICSCCNKSWRPKSNAGRFLEASLVGFGASKANAKPPLPRGRGRSRFCHRDSLKRLRKRFMGPTADEHVEESSIVGTLSRVGCTKLKVSSDSESEYPLDDHVIGNYDDGNTGSNEIRRIKPEYDVEFGIGQPIKTKQTHQDSEMKDHPGLLHLNEPKNVDSTSLDSLLKHGLMELNGAESFGKPSHDLTSEPISLDRVPQPPIERSTGTSDFSSDTMTIRDKPIDIGGTSGKVNTSATVHTEAASGTSSDDTRPSESNAKIEEDMESPPQVSNSEVGLFPKVESRKDEDSSYESLDGMSSVSDIEGESIVDRLRRQVEHDRSRMISLHKELEAERNAAAIAANEAMAMITRLQEEKAALHMEALQYLRMMEEQSEYDMKALERTNDLLNEREMEMQDLEYELEIYKNKYPDESGIDDMEKLKSQQ